MEDLEKYIVYLNGILNIAVIGFVIKFSLFMKAAFKEKEDVLLKRLDLFEQDLKRTEKWAGRRQEELEKEKDSLQKKLDQVLVDADINVHSLDLLTSVQQVNSEFKSSLKSISEKIESLESNTDHRDPSLYISMAKAFASNGEWFKAASKYDLATREITDNWELYFYKGVAFANSRNGQETFLKALQGYVDALVYLPEGIDKNTRARLYIYKGAMLKRLNRIDEAEKDIDLGLMYATNDYEIADGLYNLGCIFAMKGDENRFREISSKLKEKDPEKYDYLLYRIEDYAPEFSYSKTI